MGLAAATRRRLGLWPRSALAAIVILALMPTGGTVAADTRSDDERQRPAMVPGDGQTIRLARPTWDTGWFQAEIMAQLLDELGFTVDGPATLDNDEFYRGVAAGDVDLWVNGWFPLHDQLLELGGDQPGTPIGFEVRGGALQGYLADRATVERLGIETLADLADPEVAAAFDRDDDGRADLIGCNQGWACGPIVDHHLSAYGLDGTVDHVRGDYGPLMRDTVERYEAGEPVLFYTFTPNWTIGQLVPGRDVAWIPVPFPSLPDGSAELEPATEVPSVEGCPVDPCSMGFPPNDIRAVARPALLTEQPSIAKLLEGLEIPLVDISDQNARMVAGEDSTLDIVEHARRWIAANRATVDGWLRDAIDAHVAAGLPLFPRESDSAGRSAAVGSIRVVTKLSPPFVTYDGTEYGGFSIELLEILAEELDADVELYAVNTSAKLLDDVARGAADGGIGAVAITSSREERVDFSQPYIESGLQIMVADRDQGLFGGQTGSLLRAIFSWDLFVLVAVLSALLIIAAHLIWLSERRHNPDFPESYRSGVWEGLWWAAVTATTVGYGDKTPSGRLGRVFGLLWMFSGLFVLAYFTAGIATAFAIDELTSSVAGPDDLRGHTIGVPADSDAADYLDRRGIAAEVFPSADEAYRATLDGEVDAVVHDAAALQRFVTVEGASGAHVVGPVFAERGFGIALPTGGELTEPINRALLELVESGRYDELHDSWFGERTAGG